MHPLVLQPLPRKLRKGLFRFLSTPQRDAVMVVERELTHHQVGLVDTCFEEGDYDAAISALDKLRHPASKPYE